MQMGVFESCIKFIAADGADGAYVRVVITPDIIDGKRTEKAVVTVFDKSGKQLSEISSKDMSIKDFNRSISELKAEYGLYKCHSFDKREDTESFVEKQQEEKAKKVRRQVSD